MSRPPFDGTAENSHSNPYQSMTHPMLCGPAEHSHRGPYDCDSNSPGNAAQYLCRKHQISRMYEDRTDAGRQLGRELRDRGITADVVLAIPRGGLPLGRAVADALDAPLDIVVARKMGAPGNPELAIGAVASDGSVYRNEDLIADLRVEDDYLAEARETEARNARQKAQRYREGDPPDLAGKRVVVVDDGVATGATATACLRQVRAEGAESVVLAVPVGSPRTVGDLESEADEVICLETPDYFRAVGQFYERFDQVVDEEAMAYLGGGEGKNG